MTAPTNTELADGLHGEINGIRRRRDVLVAEAGEILTRNTDALVGDDLTRQEAIEAELDQLRTRERRMASILDHTSASTGPVAARQSGDHDGRGPAGPSVFHGFDGGGTLIQPNTAVRAWDGLSSVGTVDRWSPSEMRSRAAIAVETMPGLEAASRSKLDKMLDSEPASARFLLALGNPSYRSAFDQWLQSPDTAHLAMSPEQGAAWRDVESTRAAMGIAGPNALLPLDIDPSIILTNAGSFSDVRSYAKIRTTTLPSVRNVTSAGVTAEIKGEGVEAADASPTLAAVDTTVFLIDASVTVSYELFEDTNVADQLGGMFADARANFENRVFVTGAGTTEPFGAATVLAATTASRVAATTSSTFTTASMADVFHVRDNVPARHRQARPSSTAWASNIAIQSVIQQMGAANVGPNGFWATLADGPNGFLLGFPSMEATAMTGTIGSGAVILMLMDWSRYLIVDRLGTAIVRTNVLGDNQRSTGQVEMFSYWRTGGGVLDTNAGRVLKL